MPAARRTLLLASLLLSAWPRAWALERRPLAFPRDHGAHPETRIEWWYLTGLLGTAPEAPAFGYQLTFFRLRHPDAAVQQHPSALAPRQLLLAHVALSDLQRGRLRHEQRVARLGLGASAAEADSALALQDWRLRHLGQGRYEAAFGGAGFQLRLQLHSDQPPLLQGEAGWSRKGPGETEASRYYSRPQLRTQATLRLDAGQPLALVGRSWLDHEWSDALLPAAAVGWDWLGINLLDGRALTAFRLRRADGSTLWSGGSWGGGSSSAPARSFAPQALRMLPQRHWHSPASGARYPVAWHIEGPGFEQQGWRVEPLMDAQEIDARASSGLVYWEGAVALRDAKGRLLGHGYLELTGYARRLRLG